MEIDNPLGYRKVSKLLANYSIPAIAGMLVNALYNIVDRIYIGNATELGANGLAGITIAFPIMIIIIAFGVLFGTGGATLFSINLGKGELKEADKALSNALIMLLLVGALFLIIGQAFLEQILKIFGASEMIMPYAQEYLRVILFGAVFQLVGMGLNSFLRADGRPGMAMLTMFLGAGINIILDPILIFGFNMGMAGAAIATITAQCASMIWTLHYFLRKSPNHKIKLRNLKPQPWVIQRITILGMPNFLMQLCNGLLNMILNQNLLLYGGDIAVSAMGIVNSIQTILLMPLTGLIQGVQPIVSYNFGANKFERVRSAEKLAIIIASAIVIVGWIVTRLFPTQLVSLFNREEELLEFGSYALRTWFWCLPVIGFQVVGANFFQATGRSMTAMLLTLSRQIILLIPAIILFSRLGGLSGLLYAAPFADAVAVVVTGITFYFGIRKLPK